MGDLTWRRSIPAVFTVGPFLLVSVLGVVAVIRVVRGRDRFNR